MRDGVIFGVCMIVVVVVASLILGIGGQIYGWFDASPNGGGAPKLPCIDVNLPGCNCDCLRPKASRETTDDGASVLTTNNVPAHNVIPYLGVQGCLSEVDLGWDVPTSGFKRCGSGMVFNYKDGSCISFDEFAYPHFGPLGFAGVPSSDLSSSRPFDSLSVMEIAPAACLDCYDQASCSKVGVTMSPAAASPSTACNGDYSGRQRLVLQNEWVRCRDRSQGQNWTRGTNCPVWPDSDSTPISGAKSNDTGIALDRWHSHTQPTTGNDGDPKQCAPNTSLYHCHGGACAFGNDVLNTRQTRNKIVGYALDGAPIKGLHSEVLSASKGLRPAKPCYELCASGSRRRDGSACRVVGDGDAPLGALHGDWVYNPDIPGCNLDQCNFANGVYHFTDTYPFMPPCLNGRVDPERWAKAKN